MAASEQEFLALTQTLIETGADFMTELGPLILAAAKLEVAGDTRGFAHKFEVAHALVLREAQHLQDDLGLLELQDRSDKSGRLFFSLTAQGRSLGAQGQ